MYSLLIEAIVVGIATVFVGTLILFILSKIMKCCEINSSKSLITVIIGQFLTGFILHLLFEVMGGNKWYCKNGFACQ